jgi:hypothetical protein
VVAAVTDPNAAQADEGISPRATPIAGDAAERDETAGDATAAEPTWAT